MEDPISDNNVSTTNGLSDNGYDVTPPMMMEQCWDLKEEAEVIEHAEEMPEMVLGIPVGGYGSSDDCGMGNGGGFGDSRSRFRGRLGAKGIGGPMPPLAEQFGRFL